VYQENVYNYCHQMLYFKAKMHQLNLISAEALPQTLLGELTALPRPSSWIQGVLLLIEGGRKRKCGREMKGKRSRGWQKGKQEEGRSKGNILPYWLKSIFATDNSSESLQDSDCLDLSKAVKIHLFMCVRTVSEMRRLNLLRCCPLVPQYTTLSHWSLSGG